MWNKENAKAWMLDTAIELSQAYCFYEEAGKLLCHATSGNGCDSMDLFSEVLRDVLWWDDHDIGQAIKAIEGAE